MPHPQTQTRRRQLPAGRLTPTANKLPKLWRRERARQQARKDFSGLLPFGASRFQRRYARAPLLPRPSEAGANIPVVGFVERDRSKGAGRPRYNAGLVRRKCSCPLGQNAPATKKPSLGLVDRQYAALLSPNVMQREAVDPIRQEARQI